MTAETQKTRGNDEDYAEHDDDSSFVFGPIRSSGELVKGIALLEGEGCHFDYKTS